MFLNRHLLFSEIHINLYIYLLFLCLGSLKYTHTYNFCLFVCVCVCVCVCMGGGEVEGFTEANYLYTDHAILFRMSQNREFGAHKKYMYAFLTNKVCLLN